MPKLSVNQWLEIFTDWENSGLQQRKFCCQRQISYTTMVRKRSEYIAKGLVLSRRHDHPSSRKNRPRERASDAGLAGFIPISQTINSTQETTSTSLESANSVMEISLPNGICLRIPTNACS